MKYTVSIIENKYISTSASNSAMCGYVYEDRLLNETREPALERLQGKGKSFSQGDQFFFKGKDEV